MAITKQYRWLLFLLVPLIICMIILLTLSVTFVFFSKIFSTHTYNSEINLNSQKLLQAEGKLISLRINSIFRQYNQILNYFDSQIGSKNYYNVKNVELNNGFQFYAKYPDTDTIYVQARSMWFNADRKTITELDQVQKNIYSQYIGQQIKIKLTLDQIFKKQNNFVQGIYTLYSQNESSMAFFYPSFSQQIPQIYNTTLGQSMYYHILQSYYQNNNSYFFVSGNFGGNVNSLCKLTFDQNPSPKGLACLALNIQKFIQFLNEDFSVINSRFNDFDFFFVTPNYENIQSPWIINDVYDEKYQIDDFKDHVQPLIGQNILDQGFSTYQSQGERFMIYPIQMSNYVTKQQNAIFYVIVEVDLKNASGNVQIDSVINSIIKTIIPITVILLIILIASFIILKCLLNDLDVELHKINQCCQFILNGDIQIDIPNYQGTKDIVQIYQCAQSINKLHKYSCNDFFTGHFSSRILKYNEALNHLQLLKYDPSFIKENIGDAFSYIQQYELSIQYLKQSVLAMQKTIKQKYNFSQDKMLDLKERKQRLSKKYKQDELILIRRLWKLIYSAFRHTNLQNLEENYNHKYYDSSETEIIENKKQIRKQMLQYINKFKMAVYPDLKSFSETIWVLNFQIKLYIQDGRYQLARETINRCQALVLMYAKQYESNGKKMKEKGSKNLFFYRKNKLTSLSRCNPHILIAYTQYSKALLLSSDPQNRDYYQAYLILIEALKTNVYSKTINYLILNQIKKILQKFDLGTQAFQSTQIFNQSMPYKALYYGQRAQGKQHLLYKFAKKPDEVECSQYVILLDSSFIFLEQSQERKQKKYLKERIEYLYEKLIKSYDRVCIAKCNSEIGLETMCNLLSVERNCQLLKKSLKDLVQANEFIGKSNLSTSIQRIFYRIKKLKSHKVLCIYLKNIHSYVKQSQYQGKLKDKKKLFKKISILFDKTDEINKNFHSVGEKIENAMKNEQLHNCKVIMIGAINDKREDIINFFGLKDINKRICNQVNYCNINNNVVYIIEDKNKADLDRILMSKATFLTENHVFIL